MLANVINNAAMRRRLAEMSGNELRFVSSFRSITVIVAGEDVKSFKNLFSVAF